MTKFEAFSAWDATLKGEVAAQLNGSGIVSDEDGLGLSSTWIESWDEEFTEHLRNFGYTGGEINNVGKYFSHGAVYALYNEAKTTHLKAMAYIKKLADAGM
ncbi:hypothetical protein AAGW18_16070 [Vreelandella titanicae]|jgi:hypothetical protein|uniref:hypothetical protein n=1 Tax=Halomonadaceae TaxID=28256 RepID=UPI001E534D30|nr:MULTISPECIES: hypothetical protein [Halomonas]MCD1584570.1 hypothetical protein [Halomonas sp. IOP_14]